MNRAAPLAINPTSNKRMIRRCCLRRRANAAAARRQNDFASKLRIWARSGSAPRAVTGRSGRRARTRIRQTHPLRAGSDAQASSRKDFPCRGVNGWPQRGPSCPDDSTPTADMPDAPGRLLGRRHACGARSGVGGSRTGTAVRRVQRIAIRPGARQGRFVSPRHADTPGRPLWPGQPPTLPQPRSRYGFLP